MTAITSLGLKDKRKKEILVPEPVNTGAGEEGPLEMGHQSRQGEEKKSPPSFPAGYFPLAKQEDSQQGCPG